MDQHTSPPRDSAADSAAESAGGGGRRPVTPAATLRVWDRLVRVLHWTLVLSVLTAWLTTKLPGATAAKVHEWAGYLVLAVIALRVMWGLAGPRYARFAQFVRGPAHTLAYARQLVTHTEPRHLGHNPLGGWMIVALLSCAVLTAASGWLYTTDRFWGIEWVETTHIWLTNLLLTLAAVHVAGAIFTGWRQRENLIAAMFSGNKRAPQPGDIE